MIVQDESPDDIDKFDIEKLRIKGSDFYSAYNEANNRQAVLNSTCGNFKEEKDAEDCLFTFLQSTKLFSLYRQLDGVPIFRHHLQQIQDVRCDILALPISDTIFTGAIVIEAKKTGEKIGPGISQLLDYLHSVFTVRNGIGVIPTLGLLFPCHKQNSATASWMQHQHIGTIETNDYKRHLLVYSGEERLLEFGEDGSLLFSKKSKSGRKMGSR